MCPSWGYVGPSWGLCWPFLGLCWPILGLSWPIFLGARLPHAEAMLVHLAAYAKGSAAGRRPLSPTERRETPTAMPRPGQGAPGRILGTLVACPPWLVHMTLASYKMATPTYPTSFQAAKHAKQPAMAFSFPNYPQLRDVIQAPAGLGRIPRPTNTP